MNGARFGRSGGREGFARDFLADLHAGVVDDDIAAAVWPRVRADPAAAAYLQSLDDVVATLRTRGADLDAELAVPPAVRVRIDAALAEAALADCESGTDVAADSGAGPRREIRSAHIDSVPAARRRLLLAAAAAVLTLGAVGLGIVVGYERTESEPSVAAPTTDPPAPSPPGTEATGLDARLIAATVGTDDRGRYADPALLAGCLAANGVDPESAVLGIGEVTVDGADATLVVVPGSRPGALVALAVGTECGPGSADTVSRAEIG